MKTTVFSFTHGGLALGNQICAFLPDAALISDYTVKSLQAQAEAAFHTSESLVFIGAAGIAVRAIAPHLQAKDKDPAVVVVDEAARFFIPILSGHIGGANQMATMLAAHFGGQAVLTTATDVNNCFAVDLWAKENHLSILNISAVKHISAALLQGKPVFFSSCFHVEGMIPPFFTGNSPDGTTPAVTIVEKPSQVFLPQTLYLLPRQYALGVGCKKDVPEEIFEEAVLAALKIHDIPIEALGAVGTITLKAQEKAVLAFAKKYRLPLYVYTAEQLATAPGSFTSSDFVKQTTGVDNVCERSAALLSNSGEPVLLKTAKNGVTVAVFRNKLCLRFA